MGVELFTACYSVDVRPKPSVVLRCADLPPSLSCSVVAAAAAAVASRRINAIRSFPLQSNLFHATLLQKLIVELRSL